MTLFTIGFTKKTAETFFGLLQQSGASRLVDVRLNNVSQLAGFAKREDLRYFLSSLCGMTYDHDLRLAPTQDLLDEYKKRGGQWATYESAFLALMRSRRVDETIAPEALDNVVLLCSEATPHYCHRRLVAEYLEQQWGGLDVQHL